ncbi:MAG: SMC-Scp complex subunit ScpB [Pseudomonadota bacterium]
MQTGQLKNILESALLAAGQPLSIDRLLALFVDENQPSRDEVQTALSALEEDYAQRGIELKEVANGYRIQVKSEMAEWVSRLWDERPQRYSRAVLETLALIAYRQPITRAEIEEVRGVAVSTNVIKTLQEREWVRVVGHRDVPGRPALYATTKEFLDYFNLKGLNELPSLMELRDIESIEADIAMSLPGMAIEGEAQPEQQVDLVQVSEDRAVAADDEQDAVITAANDPAIVIESAQALSEDVPPAEEETRADTGAYANS